VRAGGKGDVTKTHVVWTQRHQGGIGTPILHDGRIYFVSGGVAHFIYAQNGERVQPPPFPGRDHLHARLIGVEALAETIFESTVTITVTSKVKDKVAFLVEGKQAGIFEAANIPAEQLDPLLGIGCPNIVYPYLRANIADMITRAGFPPVHLAEINFEAFYQQRLQALAEQQPQSPSGSGIVMPDGTAAKH